MFIYRTFLLSLDLKRLLIDMPKVSFKEVRNFTLVEWGFKW